MKLPFFHRETHGSARRVVRPKARITHRADWLLLLLTAVLSVFGLLMVYNASIAIALRDFSDRFYFVREQFRGFVLGFILLAVFSFIDYRKWYKFALPLLFGAIVMLIAVFVPGLGVKALGAHRWIRVAGFVFQPAEVTKLVLVVYLSAWFAFRERGRLPPFLLLLCMVVGLIILEPDLGTAIIIVSIAMMLYFLSGAPLSHFALITPLLVVGVLILSVISPYRFRRLTTFLNPQSDPQGASYQIRQALLAVGSGGMFGVGLGRSRQKYEYLPEANTDSIFAIIGEETGFVGGVGLMALYMLLVWRGFRIARRMPDKFGMYLALGISSWVGIQALINIAANVALVPLTGVPLPFISYGSSNLTILLASMGILINISKQA